MEMNPYPIAPLISFIVLLAGGFYIVKKKTRRIFNWILALSIFILSIVEFGNFMVLISPNPQRAMFWQRWVFLGLSLLPIFWTIFSLVFARENYTASLKKRGWYLILVSIATLCFLAFLPGQTLIKSVEATSKGYGFVLGRPGWYLFIFLLLSLTAILLNFENTYRSLQGEKREKIKYAILGLAVFICSYIILSSLALLFSYIDSRWTVLGSTAIIAGIILMAYSIFKYGFMDVDVYVGRQAIYTSATLSIVGLYLVMVGLVAKIFISSGINLKTFFSFVAAFFAFLTFILLIFSKSLKERLRLFIDRSFYKDKYDYRREWGSLNERIGSILNVDELILEIKKLIKEIMFVEKAEVVLLELASSRVSELNGLLNGRLEAEALAEWLLRFGEPISVKEFSRRQPKLYEEYKGFLEKLGVYILVSLNAKQRTLGMLGVGRKIGGREFTSEDFGLLKTIGRQVSVSILNAKLSEELIISKEMESFHKVSSFILHDLKNFVSMLSLVVQNAASNFSNPEFQKDSLKTISETIFKMNNLMQKLSGLPKRLELSPQVLNINDLIEEAINKNKIDNITSVKLSKLFGNVPPLSIDAEYIHKVIQNLLLNAIESMPNGGNLTISTRYATADTLNPAPDTLSPAPPSSDGRYIEIAVSDTGCGMSKEFIQQRLFKPFQSTKKKGLGIGLFQCKTIVEAHGGEINVESKEGKGTTFMVKLPVNREQGVGRSV